MMKRAVIVVLLAALIGVAARAYYRRAGASDVDVKTAPVTEGTIVDAISASGTLQAVTTVQVGSQVSGTISWLGADFNSIVRKGQVIAKLDPSLLNAQIEQARANVVRAQADLERNQVALNDAEQKRVRADELGARQLLPQSDVDTARAAVDSARAQVQSSKAQVVQAQAALNQAQVNAAHTVIAAPIDGIVIQRQVDVGQTVAASLQSPTIFTIAADLTKMEVNASIDESDIGRVGQGQRVRFAVDAYPNKEFAGVVEQVRLQPTVVQNVTTYSTIISAPNPDLELKPGMTANVRIEVARADRTLRVPNAALKFKPTAETFRALEQPVPAQVAGGPHVWVLTDGGLKPVKVQAGITDGMTTQIKAADLAPGASVVTSVVTATANATRSATPSASPLIPQRPQRGR